MRRSQRGFTLIELLISLVIVGLLFAAALGFFLDVSWRAREQAIIAATYEDAQSVAAFIGRELRLAGAGVPFTQSGFAVGAPGLGDAPLPLLTDSDAASLTFRAAIKGVLAVLTVDYTPAANRLTFTVNSTAGFRDDERVYLSNMTRGGNGALAGTITGLSGQQVTIRNPFVASSGAVFQAGSTAQPVSTVTFESTSFAAGITRSEGGGVTTLAPNAGVTFQYLDRALQPIALPLSEAEIMTQLAAVRITVEMEPGQRLRYHPNFRASVSELVSLRNLLTPGS